MAEEKKVMIFLEEIVCFEICGIDREDVNFKVSAGGREVNVKLCADSLMELIIELSSIVESLLSKLKDRSYSIPKVQLSPR
jgi:hypothetical protein